MNYNLESIGNLSREAFKKKTKEMAIIYAFEYLLSKKDAYSKLDRLNYNELKIQNYLMNGDLSFVEKLIIVTAQPHLNHNPTPTQQKVG